MMAWILKSVRKYTNGMTAVHYFEDDPFGLFCCVTSDPKEARQFKSKREANALAKRYGFEAVRLEDEKGA